MDFAAFLAHYKLALIPALPLAAAVICAVLGARCLRGRCHLPVIGALALSFLCSLWLLEEVWRGNRDLAESLETAPNVGYERILSLWTWAQIDGALDLDQAPEAVASAASFLGVQSLRLDVVLRADALTAIMLVMVTFVATLVALFASGYMRGDPGYWRFFAYIGLFVFSMTMLVSVSNFVLLFVFWEAVGLCSYLLIGFWYQKPEAAAAGKKAFLVNRVGDFGFALALFLIWTTYGSLNFHDTLLDGSSDSDDVRAAWRDVSAGTVPLETQLVRGVLGPARIATNEYVGGGLGLAICLLLMLGACGKSAQFPLHVWLPDAMEGPTPVSALIHAATMVTAGVYMVTRCTPLFAAAPDAQLIVACIGGFTGLLAGLIAMTQHDLKRVLAYSTVSQLGYMFLGLGVGTRAGIAAGMFHLFTHAFFKALLFLGSGSVMHAMGGVIDMRKFGGLRKKLPHTYWTFLVGCLALSGVPFLSGFWSKDSILGAVHDKVHALEHELHARHEPAKRVPAPTDAPRIDSPSDKLVNPLERLSEEQLERQATTFAWLYRGALFTALLTAFYTFRAFCRTFHGKEVIPDEAHGHAHESPPEMLAPLVVLAICSVFVGVFCDRTYLNGTHLFGDFLNLTPSLAVETVRATPGLHEFHDSIAALSGVIALVGIGIALYLYLGDVREVRSLTSLMNFEWLTRVTSAQTVMRLRRWPLVAACETGLRRVGLGWLSSLLGYLLLTAVLIVGAPIMIGYFVSPYRLSSGKFFLDEIYDALLVKPLKGLADLSYAIDRGVVDGLVNLIGRMPPALGGVVRSLQFGLVQFYALAMVLGVLAFAAVKLLVAGV